MKRILFAVPFTVALLTGASAQQAARPTADQVQIQILENDAHNLRAAIAQLAVDKNNLTAERDALKAKCGKPCEEAPSSK